MSQLTPKIQHIIQRYPYGILCLVATIPLFFNLGHWAIREWDESRLVANALEMYYNNNFLVTYFDGNPDMWNTKPPLMIWLQVVMLHLIGFSEWAFRLPSALAGLITIIYIFYFSKKHTQNTSIAWLCVLVLITTRGFIDKHVTRTGDYDALLVCFAVLSFGVLYNYLSSNKNRYLYYFAIFLALAILTKGPAIALFFPGLLIAVFLLKAHVGLLKNKHTYGAILLLIGLALPYYFIREHYNPGYLIAVYENELGGRFLKTLENNHGPWYQYLENMTGRDFTIWFIFIPIGFYFVTKEKNTALKRVTIYAATLAIGFFIMISISKTKLGWYDAPAYPFLSVVVGYALYKLLYLAKQWNNGYRYTLNTFLFLLFPIAYILLLIENVFAKDKHLDEGRYELSYYIRDIYLNKPSGLDTNIYILHAGKEKILNSGMSSSTHYLYYTQLKRAGYTIHFIEDLNTLPTNTPIVVQEANLWHKVEHHYNNQIAIVDTFHVLKVFIINQ